MMKKIKNMTKKARVITVLILAIALVLGASGIVLYANEINVNVEQTQKAYWSLKLPDTNTYNDNELLEYNLLLEKREEHFYNKNYDALVSMQNDFDNLDNSVKMRIQLEEIQKKYDAKKIEVEAINVNENANDTERDAFDTQKNNVLKMIQEKNSFEDIDNALNELKAINTNIENRVTAENQAKQNSGYYNNSYYSDDDSYDSADYPDYSDAGNDTDSGVTTPPSIESPWGDDCDDSSCWEWD